MTSTPRLIGRYVSGRPLDGRIGHPYLTRGPARWPGWKRQVARLAVPAAGVTALIDPTMAGHTAVAAGLAAAEVGRRRLRRRRFRRAYISPTLDALQPVAGGAQVKLHVDTGLGTLTPRLAKPLSPAERAVRDWYGRWVEPGLRYPGVQALRAFWAAQRAVRPVAGPVATALRRPVVKPGPRIQLDIATAYLTKEQCGAVSAIIHAKIPVADTDERWNMVGDHVTATWTVRRRPPLTVGLADLEAAFDRLTETQFYLGQTAANNPHIVDLDDDSAHIAASGGSGSGKSVLAQLPAVQVLRRGGRVVILDRKGSHRWAIGLAGVDYCSRPEQMHDALLKLAKLADDRNQEHFDEGDDWRPEYRVLVICEELNATIGQLRKYWAQNREKGEPKASPAIDALGDILYMGRSALVNVLAIAQMLTAQAIGGPGARENFAVRCLARYTKNAWQMLVPEAAMPRPSRVRGRWQIVSAGEATEVQVCYLTRAQARAFAGVPGSAEGLDSPMTSNVAGNGTETGNTVDPLAEPITMRQAIDEGVVPWPKANAKMRLSRARKAGRPVPAPCGKRGMQTDLYRRGDLIAWTESERVS